MGYLDLNLNISRIRKYNKVNGRRERMEKLMARKLPPSAAEQPTAESDESKRCYMNSKLKVAAMEGDVERFLTILEEVCEEQQLQPYTILKQSDYKGNTCVHIAAKHGRHELIGFLTTLSASRTLFQQTNEGGDNALHKAAKAGHLSVTDLLIRYGQEARLCYMDKENGKGNVPLHEALLHNHQHVVDLLFHLGAHYSFCLNKERKSPFYLCLEAGNIETFNAMLKADTWTSTDFDDMIETQFMNGKSVLHAAISRKDKVMLQGILAKGMHTLLHVKDENGQSPIELASTIGFNEGQNILSLELRKDITTGDLCVNEQVFEQSPDVLSTPSVKEEQEKRDGVIKQSPDWDGIYERMGKLLRSVTVSQQLQGMHQHCMDFGLYEAAKRGNVDEFISALEQYSVEKNLALTTIFGEITPLQNTFLHVASRYGHKNLTWLIMCYFPSLLDRVNCHGNTALHLACREGNPGVVKILVKLRKGKLRNELQQSITNVAMSGMKEDMQMIIAENDEGRTPLQLAQKNYNIDVVDFLIKEHVEVAYHVNQKGTSLLYIVIINGRTEQLNKIFSTVSHNVDQKVLDDQLTKGKSLILAAIRSWKIEILQELARQKPMLFNIKYEHAQKLVHFAELFGFHEAANYLRSEFKLEIVLDNPIAAAIPNVPSHSYCLDAYSLSITELVDPKIENIRQLMHRKGRDERMRKLICNRSLQYMPLNYLEKPMDIKLYEAAKKGDVDSFIGALENISQENSSYLQTILQQRTHIGNTFLHVAAIHGNEDFTAFIVFYFRNLSREKNKKGNTAIHEAAKAGHLGVLEILIRVVKYHEQLYTSKEYDIGGPPIGIPESWLNDLMYTSAENTYVLEAFVNNQRKVIDYLIKSSVKEAWHVNKEGKSGLYFAVEAGMVDAVKTILSSITADGNLKYICELTNGKSLLNAATRRRSTVMFQEISRKIPAQIHVIDEDGQTPLFFTVSTGFLEGLNCLLDEFNMDSSQKDSSGHNLVHIASKSGHVHILQKLMQNFPDAERFVNRERQNILHIAAIFGRDNVVRFILQTPDLECLINEKDDDGNTPLHLATINWHPKVVSSLTWDHRVNLKLVNKDGLTALDTAEECMEPITSFQQRLTWTALMSAGTPRAGYKNRKVSKKHNLSAKDEQYKMDHSKDRVNTLLLVATLVATVTFAAGFTMPGGHNNSGPKEGQATLLRKLMMQTFVICDTIALYSSITVAVTLIWAQLGDLTLVVNALRFALPLLSISLTTMSVAFMVGVSLVVESLTWLAGFVLTFGILSLASVLTLFIPLCFPGTSTSPVLRYITYYIFHLLVLASGSSDDRHIKEQ